MDNLIIVDSPNSLLISKKGSSDKLREVSKKLQNYQSNNLEQEKFLKPWGYYEILLDSNKTKVKRLTIFPDSRLSYQYHNYRNEHWIIISGIAEIKLDDEIKTYSENENIYIEKNETLYKEHS